MVANVQSIKTILFIDALLNVFGILGIYLISLKADLPFETSFTEAGIVIHKSTDKQQISLEGRIIRAIDGYAFTSSEQKETYLDNLSVNEFVNLYLNKNETAKIRLVNYYSSGYILLAWIIGTSFFVIALIVLIKSRSLKPARVFHWVCIFTALIMMMTWGYLNMYPKPLGFFVRGVLHFAVSIVPALFLHFTMLFPKEKKIFSKHAVKSLYVVSSIIFLVLNYNFLSLINHKSIESITAYVLSYNISGIFLIVCVVAALIVFIHSYKTSPSESDKKKLKWILYGLSIGPLSFILFWTVPIILTDKSLLPEEVILVLVSVIPITFGISIVKYHVMDIDQIINRSVVYSFVIGVLLILYLLIIALLTNFTASIDFKFSAVLSALTIALLFQPVRSRVQEFVDRKFFRVKYNFREAIRNLFSTINEAVEINSLAEKLLKGLDELVPVEKIGLFLLNSHKKTLKIIAHKNFDLLVNRSIAFHQENLKTDLSLPVAMPGTFEPGVKVEFADNEVFKRWGINLVFALKSTENVLNGFLVLGSKRSGAKFTIEDIDLLNTVANRLTASIDKIKLNEELLIERIESERLDELNRIKSYFISSVSHDMKTPLTSIKMFAELLQYSGELKTEKSKEYLEIIDGESSRLSRLIDNVLDFSKIERGVKQYRFETIKLNEIVDHTLKMMHYQFKLQKFLVEINLTNDEKTIFADKDAVEEAFINLLTNSLKYTKENKVIRISTYFQNNFMALEVEDDGIGINKKDLDNIFNPFFRINSEEVHRTGGAGLGLSIVKHILDAHKGKIEVQSEPGKGSRFILLFPVEDFRNI
jgi:signal transduction histidine kinase